MPHEARAAADRTEFEHDASDQARWMRPNKATRQTRPPPEDTRPLSFQVKAVHSLYARSVWTLGAVVCKQGWGGWGRVGWGAGGSWGGVGRGEVG